MVFFAPLFFMPPIWNLYTIPKECFIRIAIALLLIAWALEAISSAGKWEIRFSPLGIPLILYFIAITVSLFYAINPYTGVYEFLRRITYILLFLLAINHIRNQRDISAICGASVAAGLIVSILGTFQYFTSFNPDWLYQAARPSATFGHKNIAAHYVTMIIPLSLALYLQARNEKMRLFWAMATIEMVAYAVYANSRGAWLGLVFGGLVCLVFFILAGRPNFHWGLSPKRTSLLVFLISLHVVLPHILPMPAKLEVKYSDRTASMMELEGSAGNRIAVWANTIDLIRDNPYGIGLNNWEVVYPKYIYSRKPDKESTSETHLRDAHNDYIQMVSEISVVGLAFYLWMLVLLLKGCWKPSDLKYSPFLLWSIVGFMIISCFSFPIKMPVTCLFFWLIAGLIIVNRDMAAPPLTKQKWSLKAGKVFAFSMLGFSIIWLVFTGAFTYRQLLSDYYLKDAYFLAARSKFTDSLKAYNRVVELNPFSYRAYFGRGMAYHALGKYEAAAKDNLSTLGLYPNNINAHGNLGMAYSEQSLFELAQREYEETLRLYPEDSRASYRIKELEGKRALYLQTRTEYESLQSSFPDSARAWYYRGYLHFLSGLLDDAIACYKEAIAKDAHYAEAHNNMADTYRKKRLFDQAIDEYKKAIRVNQAFVQAYRGLGRAYEGKRLFKEAIKAYLGALQLKPNDADIYLDLGGLYLTRLYDRDQALFHLKKSLDLNPGHSRAKQIRSTIKTLSGK